MYFVLIFSLTVGFCVNSCFAVVTGDDIFVWARMLTGIIEKSITLYDEFTEDPLHLSVREKRLSDSLNNITQFIKRVETDIPQVTIAKFNQLERDFSEIIHFEIKLDYLTKQINKIEDKYKEFLSLQKKLKAKVANDTAAKSISLQWVLRDFATSVVTMQGDSIRSSLSVINDLIDINDSTPFYSKRDFFMLILNNFNDRVASRCLIDKSPQQLIFDTLTSFKLIQLKGLAMIEYSYVILHLYTQGDFKDFMSEFKDLMLERLNKQTEIAMNVINQADNSYWRCDPNKHIAEQTYTEITRLLQGYIHNEKELSHKDSCFEGCSFYQYENRPKCSHGDKLCRSQPSCAGRVFDCKFVNEDMNICFSSTKGESRRYEWVSYYGGPNFGDTSRQCSIGSTRIEKFRKLLMWRCLYCFCLCDEEIFSDRYFSLEESLSDINNNKIVVGVKFIKRNRIIHLQVKEGKLNPMGLIDNSSLSWVTLPNTTVENWIDVRKYHKLSYESRSFDLDEIIAPAGYLLTGVRMRVIGSHLNVESRFTGFDFSTGKLFLDLTFWKGNDNTDASSTNPRTEFSLRSKRLPIDVRTDKHSPDSKSDSFIMFQPSDEYTDAAQSTVPFIDIQSVSPNPPIPLIGFGIIHKGALASGGFIEPKVYTLNFAGQSTLKEQLQTQI